MVFLPLEVWSVGKVLTVGEWRRWGFAEGGVGVRCPSIVLWGKAAVLGTFVMCKGGQMSYAEFLGRRAFRKRGFG